MSQRRPTQVRVYQDGGDFYEENGRHIVHACRVKDFDLDKAKRARTWFTEHYCRDQNIAPEWV